jgi:hypothetical protein
MKVRLSVMALLLALGAATASIAGETIPAWQEPGFVMEEVVVTASADEIATAQRQQMHRRARMLVASLNRSERLR